MSEYEPFPPREVSAAAARLLAESLHARARAAQEAARTAWADEITVLTTSGWVRGSLEEDLRPDRPLSTPVRSWRGIPFGATTAGEYRFREPRPAPPWQGIRDCREFGDVAPQPVYSWTDRIEGTEDCLTLDIVRPHTEHDAAPNTEKLPVVVYLHGGSFIVGSSHMLMLRGFEFAAQMGVVYVSVNFRLGALGYLDVRSLGGEACANPAVADQVLALEWVRDNIAAFGGDPNNVTLMGESAGGAAVLTLMAVPRAEGLFHRVIAQSPPIGMIHSRAQSMFWARELVDKMALPRDTTADDLRREDFADLVRSGQSMMWRAGELLYLNSCYAPTVDGELIPQHPIETFEEGAQHPVPLLIGTNSGEASFGKFLYQRQRSRERAALRLLASFDPESAPDVVAAYGGAVSRSDFGDLLTDALFWAPTVRVASEHARRYPTWMYRFDFAPAALRWLGLGAMHAMELSNIFGDPGASRVSFLTTMGKSSEMEEVTENMQAQWGAFINGGAPREDWPRYRAPQRETMIFDVQPHIEESPMEARRQAWESYDMLEWGTGRPEILKLLGFMPDDHNRG
ncbi:carboxylesterase/lipase family protein [Corynebacterium minutissimum]|uniref:Carboxylic ester hydrolase n=1 Tax=Corynebacterium minutissimum TaxID=38301 RepID=A0A2X4REF3_9CORY|nr:carboxylesterase/lipase family protein [Corynebacterium minutissimum]KHO29606.1 carboxylesterase [Corynebacterium minutissimum]MCG7229515.1 carboxylesterase/lipase family protein [Corynebacterium minutissimum]MCG7238694.1 carboxylesterase/lipase family protein [Corynebacterium minutissimum]QPS58670.1 carboxylesterase/lipase family protein [Corynebacterium minutissimum]QQA80540.1 carboxylesterase/lipase family protein [Corynebacterium minutissimum]